MSHTVLGPGKIRMNEAWVMHAGYLKCYHIACLLLFPSVPPGSHCSEEVILYTSHGPDTGSPIFALQGPSLPSFPFGKVQRKKLRLEFNFLNM